VPALHKVATEEVLDVRPSASIVNVSPDAAKRWLAQNTKNRPLKKTKLPEFVRDMKAGRWQLTGEAIKFDAAGNLLDGQNRLTAIVESGVTVPMFVIRGLAPEAQEVMDSGTPRSAADALSLHDYTGSKNLATAANAYAAWTSGFFKHAMVQSSPKFTHSEVVRIIGENPGLVDASRMTSPLRGDLPLGHGAIAAACYRFSQIDPDDTVASSPAPPLNAVGLPPAPGKGVRAAGQPSHIKAGRPACPSRKRTAPTNRKVTGNV
jgi:hypothetical protein